MRATLKAIFKANLIKLNNSQVSHPFDRKFQKKITHRKHCEHVIIIVIMGELWHSKRTKDTSVHVVVYEWFFIHPMNIETEKYFKREEKKFSFMSIIINYCRRLMHAYRYFLLLGILRFNFLLSNRRDFEVIRNCRTMT